VDKSRKKELRGKYEQMQPEMGAFVFRCKATGKVYLGVETNIPASLNGLQFQLKNGSLLVNRRLQDDWNKYGADGFEIEIVEVLEYDEKDPGKSDYSKELEILKAIWMDKLGNVEQINKRYSVK
jgi:hypothetical protein